MKKYYLTNILFLSLLSLFFTACDNDEEEAIPVVRYHDCSVWEYLKSDTENWELQTRLIERAGLVPLFDGTDPQHREITFFGLTNLSIMGFLLKTTGDNGERLYQDIADIPVELCRTFVLSYVIDGKKEREDFNDEIPGTLTGGTELPNLNGKTLRIYQTRSDYYGVPDAGPRGLFIHALESGYIARIVTSDIETRNGFVHALSTTFQIVEL